MQNGHAAPTHVSDRNQTGVKKLYGTKSMFLEYDIVKNSARQEPCQA